MSRAGEWVLVHAVGSGVGTAAAAAREGARRAMSSAPRARPTSSNGAAPLGLDAGIVPPTKDGNALDVDALAWSIVEATGGGVHVTLDLVGGAYVEANVAAAALKARHRVHRHSRGSTRLRCPSSDSWPSGST